MAMESEHRKWFCCMLGAREHYAMPRALHSVGSLETMFTDIWQPPQARRLLPQAWRRRVARRFHEELAKAPVTDFSTAAFTLELWLRLMVSDPWRRLMLRNRWFQRRRSERTVS